MLLILLILLTLRKRAVITREKHIDTCPFRLADRSSRVFANPIAALDGNESIVSFRTVVIVIYG
jgi:hypothetical protein